VSRKNFFYPTIFRHVFTLLLALLFFYFDAAAQTAQVQMTIDNDTIQIGAQTMLHISAHIPAKGTVSFRQLKDSLGKIKIVNGPKTDTARDKNDPATKTITQSYHITAFDEGAYVIPEWELQTSAGLVRTSAMTLHVKSVPVDTTRAFYDIKQPFVVSYTFWDWLKDHWLLVVLILVALLLIAAGVLYLKKRLNRPIRQKAEPPLTAAELALKKLQELRGRKSAQQEETKAYYIELTDILRDYLEIQYRIKAHEQTSAEIFATLEDKDIPADAKDHLQKVLTLADLVKFAKLQPSAAEHEQCLDDAINFVKQTGTIAHREGQTT
jgi:hypothetical protein